LDVGDDVAVANQHSHVMVRADLPECRTDTQAVGRPEPTVKNGHAKNSILSGRQEFCGQRRPTYRRIAKTYFQRRAPHTFKAKVNLPDALLSEQRDYFIRRHSELE
jgi:hypothetical protein